MRPRTFAREVAFQILYRNDLNPQSTAELRDALLEQGRYTRELLEFVRHLAEMEESGEAETPDDAELRGQWMRMPSLVEFSRSLAVGVQEHRKELDERIEQAAAHWSLDRMAATDRNLLRLGAYEILYTDVPGKVAIDEAIELAKRFGGAQSAQFVNGILDNLLKQKTTLEKGEMTNNE
jgi:transcription antitermination protein NusB